jgi:hypothetical protein
MYGRRTLKAVNLVSTMTANGYNRLPLAAVPEISQKERMKAIIVGAGLDLQRDFSLAGVYELCLDDFKKIWPNNNNMKASIRGTLQTLRNEGFIDFLGNGVYTMHVEEAVRSRAPTYITKDYEPHRCEARILDKKAHDYYQKNGCVFIPDNVRCGYMKREGCGNVCLKHFKMTKSYGKLWMGTVTTPRPNLELPENQPHHLKGQKYPYKWS